jgi:hypothetical protein
MRFGLADDLEQRCRWRTIRHAVAYAGGYSLVISDQLLAYCLPYVNQRAVIFG